jgi:hypothetical protein
MPACVPLLPPAADAGIVSPDVGDEPRVPDSTPAESIPADSPDPPLQTGQASAPSSPRKRKRRTSSAVPTSSQVPHSLAVPDWGGIQTRASSRARSVSPGIQTRASSRIRDVSPAPGQKRKAGESSDEKVSKRRKD